MSTSGRTGAERDPWSDRLSEYVDGELKAAEREALERHLVSCSECALLLADLRRVVARARTLESAPPSEDLWPGIVAQLAPRSPAAERRTAAGWWGRRFELSMPQLAAAGVLLVALSGGAMWLALRSPAGAPQAPLPGAPRTERPIAATSGDAAEPPAAETSPAMSAALAAAPGTVPATVAYGNAAGNTGYDAAVAELEQTLTAGRGQLDPRTLAVVEKNLRVIDRALVEARQAVAADPGNTWLRLHLAATMKRKVDLLRSASMLASTQG